MQGRDSRPGVERPGATARMMGSLVLLVRHLRSPLLMLATIVLLEELRQTSVRPTAAYRDLAYVVVVTLAAATDGSAKALLCALLPVTWLSYQSYVSGRWDLPDVGIVALACVTVALVVGNLAERLARLTSALDTEKRQLEANLRARTEFMNAAAHELRTPITVVKGYLSMLREGSFGPAPHRFTAVLEMVTHKADELNTLVEQLLVSGSLEAGTILNAPVSLDLRDAVRQAAERANPRATSLGAVVNCVLPSKAVVVEADPEHVARILDNLINNALTYSNGRPWVRLTVVEDGDAQVYVEDRGRGIPEEMRERIFERFVRVRDRAQPATPGTGLGLAISRDLAEQQGGSLALVRSVTHGGSLFVLRLPLYGSTSESPAHTTAPSHSR